MKRLRQRSRVSRTTSRDGYPNFSKLVWMARRSGAKGQGAMAVLQDAIMVHYGKEFEQAKKKAQRLAKKSGLEKVVTFAVSLELAIRRHPDTREWYRARGWPLEAEDLKNLRKFRENVIVVWSTATGLDVHDFAESRRNDALYLSDLEAKLLYNAWQDDYGWIFVDRRSSVTIQAARRLNSEEFVRRGPERLENQEQFILTPKGQVTAAEIDRQLPGKVKIRR